MTHVIWIWIALALLVAVIAIGRLLRRRARQRDDVEIDDDAIDRILRHGMLTTGEDEPLDDAEIARAEDQFWDESWDEPDEYGR